MKGAGTGTDFDQMMIELQNVLVPPPVEDVLFGIPGEGDVDYSVSLKLDLGTIQPSVAGPPSEPLNEKRRPRAPFLSGAAPGLRPHRAGEWCATGR